MSADPEDLPEPDRAPGAPHPRETAQVFGHAEAEAVFLDAWTSGRLHHGWLISGARGVGKATLAWAMARFLLTTPDPQDDGLFGAPPTPTSLAVDPGHPVARRMLALSEPGLFLLRRGPNEKGDRLAAQILVNEVRKLKGFFALTAPDGGRRVVIVDAADDLNANAANAILKLLEEPPARTTLLLVCHQPARLLPTIRSRCRTLRLNPLGPADMQAALDQAGMTPPAEDMPALAELGGGSVGAAIRLHQQDGLALYSEMLAIISGTPGLDRTRLLALAQSCSGKGGEDRLDLVLTLTEQLAARLARTGATGAAPGVQAGRGESTLFSRLAQGPDRGRAWATAAQQAMDRARHARAVNVDPAALVTDLFLGLSRV
jgi:DNA polymerase-3 subunit delta'